MIAIIPAFLLIIFGLAAINEYKTSKAMKDDFIITQGPTPDEALNPLRASLSALAISTEISEQGRKQIEEYRDNNL